MVQKEVANRLCAKVSTHDYGKLSVVTQYFSTPSIAIEVPSSAFVPQPKVNSSVVVLKFHKPVFDPVETKEFLKFVKHCFMMRRKKLTNNLKKLNLNISNDQLTMLGLNINSRPQELSLNQYIQLFNMFK
jgi:16S rRNA (adenine1518-N6/adenine1519-N6)-dimethyltransferase